MQEVLELISVRSITTPQDSVYHEQQELVLNVLNLNQLSIITLAARVKLLIKVNLLRKAFVLFKIRKKKAICLF